MNRKIKFRAFDEDSKTYLKGDFSLGIESGQFRGKYGEVFENVTLQQFTGVYDKNGVEIYEGDTIFHPIQGKRKIYYPFEKNSAIFGMENVENGMKSYLVNSHLYEVTN